MNARGSEEAAPGASDGEEFDFAGLYHLLRARLWVIVLWALASVALGFAYILFAPKEYASNAVLLVEEESSAVVKITDVNKEDFRMPENLKTVEQQLTNRSLYARIIEVNKLQDEPGFFGLGLLSRLMGKTLSPDVMLDILDKHYKVKLRAGTRLIDITATDKDPKLAQKLAQSLIDEYMAQFVEQRSGPSKFANKFLYEEVERLRHKLDASEQAIQAYREESQAVSFEDKQNIIVERLKDLNLRFAKAQNDRIALESDVNELAKIGQQPASLLGLGSIANAQSVLDVRSVLTQKEGAFVTTQQRYGKGHPKYVQADKELQQVRQLLSQAALDAAQALRSSYQSLRETEEQLGRVLREQESTALELNRKAIHYNALSREVESDRALFASVVSRLKETDIIQNVGQANVRLIEAPIVSAKLARLKSSLILLLAAGGGLSLGAGWVLAGHLMNPLIRTRHEAERATEWGEIAVLPSCRVRLSATEFPLVRRPASTAAEAFRFLSTSLSLMTPEGEKYVVAFTSAIQGEGKSTCAMGYAIASAQQGVRTLLLEANLRAPRLARAFSVQPPSGLAECLSGRATLEQAMVKTTVANLFLLTAGTPPSDPAALFAKDAFAHLLEAALERCELVVIDTAPATLASETLRIASAAGLVALVLRANHTSARQAAQAARLLERAGCPQVGWVLNGISRSASLEGSGRRAVVRWGAGRRPAELREEITA